MTPPSDTAPRGRQATTPSEIPARGWRDIFWRIFDKFTRDRVMLIAGGVTFYALLAIFPALAAFVSLFGLFADPRRITGLLDSLASILPDTALALLQTQLATLVSQPGGTLTLGVIVSLSIAFWSVNGGIKAVIEALNIAYEETEKRSFLRLTYVSFLFSLGAMAGAAIVVIAIGVIPAAIALLPIGTFGEWLIRVLRWIALLLLFASSLAALYRHGPSRARPRWRWVTWGSALTTLVWLLTAIAFSSYLENFTDYNATYGTLGALVGLLLWIWVSAIILIIGAELNAEMEHQTARDTTLAPEKPMGQRGAVMADTLGRTADHMP